LGVDRFAFVAFVLVLAGCGVEQRTSRHVVLATTTSVGNSGLLDVLVSAFQRQQRDLQIRSHLVGSGLALRMLARGDADMAISHAPAAESAALHANRDWRYRKIMFNDFVIVGPPDDSAHVKGASDAETAMRRIAVSSARFLSRGDRSGTHEREEVLWQRAGTRPSGDRLIVTGTGMGATLRAASETGAYTLTDRATFVQHTDVLRLAIVFDGGPLLVNTYAIIIDASGPHAADARVFFDWISDGPGRIVIHDYRLRGVQAFLTWPVGQPRENPHAMPR
jgi:tungstate transport system substrate-binding protein